MILPTTCSHLWQIPGHDRHRVHNNILLFRLIENHGVWQLFWITFYLRCYRNGIRTLVEETNRLLFFAHGFRQSHLSVHLHVNQVTAFQKYVFWPTFLHFDYTTQSLGFCLCAGAQSVLYFHSKDLSLVRPGEVVDIGENLTGYTFTVAHHKLFLDGFSHVEKYPADSENGEAETQRHTYMLSPHIHSQGGEIFQQVWPDGRSFKWNFVQNEICFSWNYVK